MVVLGEDTLDAGGDINVLGTGSGDAVVDVNVVDFS